MPAPLVVLFTGPPGTGKSTLAEAIADTVHAPVFAFDWMMGADVELDAALSRIERWELIGAVSYDRDAESLQCLYGSGKIEDRLSAR